MPLICVNCVKESALKDFIKGNGSEVEECPGCKSKKTLAIDYEESDEFYHALRAYVRFHLDEWDHNTHWGGDPIGTAIKNSKVIFEDKLFENKEYFDDLVDYVFHQVYYNEDKGVSLIYGYDDEGQPAGFYNAIKYSDSRKLSNLIKDAKEKNYLSLLKKVNTLINYCEPHINNEIENLVLYRARIGFSKHGIPFENMELHPERLYIPYRGNEISAPPIEYVTKGRMNREGFSFLYLAEDFNTAVHEVKPSPGDIISIGSFKQKRKLKIADFTKINIKDYWKTDKSLEIFEELYGIVKFASNPVGSNGTIQYLYTQLICEELIKRGFEGIKFGSSITAKNNFSIFASDSFDYDIAGQKVLRIEKFTLEYKEMGLLGDDTEIHSQ